MVLDRKPLYPNGNNFPEKLFEFYNIREKQSKITELEKLIQKFYPDIDKIGQDLKTGKIVPYIIEKNMDIERSFEYIGT